MGHSQSVGNENYCYAYLKRNCTFLKIDFPFYSSFMFLGGEKKAPQPSCPHLHTLPAVSWHVLNLQRLFATPPSPQCAPWAARCCACILRIWADVRHVSPTVISHGTVSLPWKRTVLPLCIPPKPWQPPIFLSPQVYLCPECHKIEITKYADYSDWLLSLCNINLWLFPILS